ncbi:MAG TPA: DUF2630 family protein [Candidatus Dormibacteraeota bacterium]|jgi:hypothetical protein|nr:DUF2630 family protein [Candidatus Dormibacteraeota bacterium]
MKEEGKVLSHIQRLVSEEHQLFEHPSPSADQSRRLADIRIELDQCWDLLRQRRALKETGHEPSEAKVRPAGVVKNYEG